MRIGLIARSDNTGLGNQTKELADMLKPDKVLLIDSVSFNRNVQYHQRYAEYDYKVSRGFPNTNMINNFLNNLDVVISCETFYSDNFIKIARSRGVKTILQYNYELFDNVRTPGLPLPDVLLSPSIWMIEDIKSRFGDKCRVEYLPPPTSPETFSSVMSGNIEKSHKRILHIAGKKAFADRNGTSSVLEMLKHSSADYELVIATQSRIPMEDLDPRVTVLHNNVENRQDMYKDFDAMILPRRYAGLCLPMNEALLSGLPVFMTDISPNNFILPKEWLIKSRLKEEITTKVELKIYEADAIDFAKKIDGYINKKDVTKDKKIAYEIGMKNFAVENLKQKYLDILNSI
jgi:hypothetical protein